MGRLLKITIPAAVLLSAGIVFWGYSNFAAQTEAANQDGEPQSAPKPLRLSSVVALGSIEPRDGVIYVAATAAATGARIGQLLVTEGDKVSKGDILAILDSAPALTATLSQARADVAAKELELQRAALSARKTEESLRASAKQVRAERDRAASDLKTLKTLVDKGVYQDSALRDKELVLDSSQEKLNGAEFELRYAMEKTASGESFDAAAARAALDASKAAAAKALADFDQSSVVAPTDGVILSVNAQIGEQLDDNQLLQLADISRMEVRAEVFESDIERIAIGNKATITSQVLKHQLQGSVRWIAQSVERQTLLSDDPAANTDNRVVTVRIALDAGSMARSARLINHQVRVAFGGADVAELETDHGAAN